MRDALTYPSVRLTHLNAHDGGESLNYTALRSDWLQRNKWQGGSSSTSAHSNLYERIFGSMLNLLSAVVLSHTTVSTSSFSNLAQQLREVHHNLWYANSRAVRLPLRGKWITGPGRFYLPSIGFPSRDQFECLNGRRRVEDENHQNPC